MPKISLVSNNSTSGTNMFGRNKNNSILITIIICICHLPNYSTLWCIIRDKHIIIWFYLLCLKNHV